MNYLTDMELSFDVQRLTVNVNLSPYLTMHEAMRRYDGMAV
jgi:hypothetical protein